VNGESASCLIRREKPRAKHFIHGWYVAQLKPNCESIAVRNCVRQGFEVFAPYEEVSVRNGGRFQVARKPLFPGYIFVGLPDDPASWRSASGTCGIARLVGYEANRPVEISPGFIAALVDRCDTGGQLLPSGNFYGNERVQIVTGPFAGFVGTIETIESNRRIWLLLEGFTNLPRVAVCADGLRKAG
jgi:transcriptional antiterminator RfaH